jgi:hypothetical protein
MGEGELIHALVWRGNLARISDVQIKPPWFVISQQSGEIFYASIKDPSASLWDDKGAISSFFKTHLYIK